MLLLLASLACTPDYEIDDDGDGFTELDGDCDDSDATIHPDGAEVCDGVDNDCDGDADEDASDQVTWYLDADGDGIGNADVEQIACDAPAGFVELSGDCDDLDASAWPEAIEVCDGVDNDCDGLVDDEDDKVKPETKTTWYLDADGDGFGDAADPGVEACDAPTDLVADNTDCDDSDAAISPADTEICDDGDVDENCNGVADDDDDTTLVSTMVTLYEDADGDGFGDPATELTQCENPGGWISTADDCDDADATTFPGAPETCNDGVVNDCDGDEESAFAECQWGGDLEAQDADITILGSEDDGFADRLQVGDIDGDGVEDLVVGSPWSSANVDGFGIVWVLYGPLTDGSSVDDGDALLSDDTEFLGNGLVVGDVDGDGYDDILVGAASNDEVDTNAGVTYLVHGPVTTLEASAQASLTVWGDGYYDALGCATGLVGDRDGDGSLELALGACQANGGGGSYSGLVYLVDGSLTGDQDVEDVAFASIGGESTYDYLGQHDRLEGRYDLSGDGTEDLILGAPRYGDGQVSLFFGPVSGDMSLDDDDATLTDGDDSDGVGTSFAVVDWDGDGYEDLWVGTVNDVSYLATGPISADVDLSTSAWVTVTADEEDDMPGASVEVGDFDGDGNPDVALGTGYQYMTVNSASHGNGAESVFIGFGPFSGSMTPSDLDATITSDEDDFGTAMVVWDADQDGQDDLLVAEDSWDMSYYLFLSPDY